MKKCALLIATAGLMSAIQSVPGLQPQMAVLIALKRAGLCPTKGGVCLENLQQFIQQSDVNPTLIAQALSKLMLTPRGIAVKCDGSPVTLSEVQAALAIAHDAPANVIEFLKNQEEILSRDS